MGPIKSSAVVAACVETCAATQGLNAWRYGRLKPHSEVQRTECLFAWQVRGRDFVGSLAATAETDAQQGWVHDRRAAHRAMADIGGGAAGTR